MNTQPIGAVVNTGLALHPARVRLVGRDVDVVPIEPAAHGDALYRRIARDEHAHLWTYMIEDPAPTPEAFDEGLQHCAASEDPFFYAIVDRSSGAAVGRAALKHVELAHRTIEVGSIVYSPELQRTRGGTEAMYLLARYVFDTLRYRRYEWKCNTLNDRSSAAALRLGFTFEGVFRQHMIVKGRNRDTAWYSMLDHEWPSRKARFERWLTPSNFDANGRQKRSLSGLPF
jgi:RimJ/RimL family protein N-acetyltransferase